MWSDNYTKLSDISRYFNLGNKKKAYQTTWIQKIVTSWEVWEFYGKPLKEGEDAKYKNPKWAVSIVSIDIRK